MPAFLVGSSDFLIVVLAITIYVVATILSRSLSSQARGLPVVGQWISDRANDFALLNYRAFGWVIDNSLHLIVKGLQLLNHLLLDIASAVVGPVANALNVLHDGINWNFAHVINPAIADLKSLHDGVDWWISNRLIPAIAELTALHAGIDFVIAHVLNPAVAELKALHAGVDWWIANEILPALTVIKSIQGYLAWLDSHVIQPAIQDIISIKGAIEGVKSRIGALENQLGLILPIIGALGLDLALARTLGKLARNPCYCFTDGSLQDNGTLELAALMDLL